MATLTSTPTTDPDLSCWSGVRPGGTLLAKNLRLRPLRESDAEKLSAQGNDPDVARWMADLPHPFSPEAARGLIARAAADGIEGRAFGFGIERIRDGALIGWIELRRGDGNTGEATVWLGRAHGGKGSGTEAVRRIARFAFRDLNLDEIRARVLLDNAASARMLAKAGFAEKGATTCGEIVSCAGRPARLFALAHADWQARYDSRPMVLVAAAALIDADGRLLVARRPEGKDMAGLWEFPGGKAASGETPETALIRELAEELSLDVRESCLAPIAFASHDYDDFHLLMPLFACRVWRGTPTPREGQELRWIHPARLADLPMPPADVPLVSLLRDLL